MKKYVFSLLVILLALFMVACDPSTPTQGGDQPETPEEPVTPPEEVVIEAPTWATGTYKNTIADSISEGMISLTIEEDNININVGGFIEISSTSATIDSSKVEGDNWIVKLSDVDVTIPNSEGNPETYNDNIVTLTIDSITANEELKMAIKVEGSLRESPLFQRVAEVLEKGISFTTETTTPPEGESFAPAWAVSDVGYTGDIIPNVPANLTITEDQFKIESSVITVDSSSNTVLANKIEGETWTIVLADITVGIKFDTVTAVITPASVEASHDIEVKVTLASVENPEVADGINNTYLANAIQFTENSV